MSVEKPSILLLSGPTLNLLGTRQPEIYGSETLSDHVERAQKKAEASGATVAHLQSNHEGDLIDAIHDARGVHDAIVINAGALTHTSVALADALLAFEGAVIELHISNPASREPYRHQSMIAVAADGLIAGFGGYGYELAIEAVLGRAKMKVSPNAR
jgi:3-dehydroquinate dehydratase-2